MPPTERPQIQTHIGPPDDYWNKEEWAPTLRGSYDYFGAYTNAPLMMPHPSHPIPRVPLMWDFSAIKNDDNANSRSISYISYNHVPGGGNVLWLDGSVEFILARISHQSGI